MMNTIVTGFEMTATQKRIWQLGRQYNSAFITAVCLQVNGNLDKDLLFAALRSVTAKHEIFNTSYQFTDANLAYPFQVVGEGDLSPAFEYINLEEQSPEEQYATIQRTYQSQLLRKNADTPFLDAVLLKQKNNVHTLILTAPAISADIQSLLNVVDESIQRYAAGNVAANDEEQPLQFTQFSEWHNELLREGDTDAEKLWNDRAKNNKTTGIALENVAGSASPLFTISSTRVEGVDQQKLAQWCAGNNCTVEEFLQSAWLVLLWQYTARQDNVLTGRVADGRSLDNFKLINGPFSKTVPFLVTVNKDMSFVQVCEQVKKETELTNTWQDNFDSKTSDATLIPAFSFEFIAAAKNEERTDNLQIRYQAMRSGVDWFRAKLFCTGYADRTELSIETNDAFFTEEAQSCLQHQLGNLINKVLDNSQLPIEQLTGVSAWEKKLVTEQFNVTQKDLVTDRSLISYIEEQAQKNPGNTAVQFKGVAISYDDFNKTANQWARLLTKKYGLGKGDIVALHLGRSAQQLICLAAILKTGAAYLPVDYNIPEERLRYILEDSGAKAIITGNDLSSELAGQATIVSTNEAVAEVATQDNSNTGITREPNDIFYVMYTSGSTGKPKGVLVPDRSIRNYALWFQSERGVTNNDSSVLFSSIAFDLNYTALWPVLISGGTLHIVEDMPVFDADNLLDILVKEKVTYVKLTPSHFNLLTGSQQFEQLAKEISLRLIVLGGEPIRVKDIEYYLQFKKDTSFLNHYGPTETTVGVLTYPIDTSDLATFSQKPLIGRPIANTQVYLLNEQNEMTPIGIPGEICIAGSNLTDGYLQRKELTDQKFIDNPFGEGKLYKTGDLGCWTSGGEIEFLGRKDFQVKINGYRIELEEIGQTIQDYGKNTRAFVAVNTNETGLAAFFTSSASINTGELKKFLARHLPEYMIPGTLVQVEAFPLLPNGKTDRTTLLNTANMKAINNDFVAPQNEMEEYLSALWQEVLEAEQVSVRDNFFDIGGNSFKLVKVFREVVKKYPGVVSLTDLFKYNTIQSFADFIQEKQKTPQPAKQNIFSFEV